MSRWEFEERHQAQSYIHFFEYIRGIDFCPLSMMIETDEVIAGNK